MKHEVCSLCKAGQQGYGEGSQFKPGGNREGGWKRLPGVGEACTAFITK